MDVLYNTFFSGGYRIKYAAEIIEVFRNAFFFRIDTEISVLLILWMFPIMPFFQTDTKISIRLKLMRSYAMFFLSD